MSLTKKEYIYKVFSKSSTEWDNFNWDEGKWSTGTEKSLVAVWRNEVINEPSFKTTINSGSAEIEIKLARPFDNYGENYDVTLGNTIELWVSDKEAVNGTLLFNGILYSYAPVLEGKSEYITILVRGNAVTLSNRILRDASGNTTVAYLSKDPSFIFKDIIDKFIVNDLGGLGYRTTDIENTNTTVSYTFNTNTYKEALDKVIELCPEGWYYRIDPDNYVYLSSKSAQIQHQISIKKDVVSLSPEKNLEDFSNEVYFIGGDTGGNNLFIKTQNATSVDNYGRFVKKIVDGRVTLSATAQIMATRVLNEKSVPTRRTRARIIDSNGTSGIGYDIESLKVGQNIQLSEITGALPVDTKWDNFVWDNAMWDNSRQADIRDLLQITSVSYSPDYVDIEATTRLPDISKRIEDISRNLDVTVSNNNPTNPTEF